MEIEKIIDKLITEKRLIIFLLLMLLTTTAIDLYTALSSPIFKEAETNPLYTSYGLVPLFVLNIILIVVFYYGFRESVKLNYLFVFVMACLFLSYGHMLGAQSNIQATKEYYESPEKIIEIIHNNSIAQKTQSYNRFVFDKIVIPYMICVTGFIIAYYIFCQRKTTREKYIDEGIKLLMKGREM